MNERAALAGVAVDVIFDSVSVATTYKEKLAEVGIIFCSISEAVRDHPELVRKYLGTRRAGRRQLLRGAQLGGVHRRLVLLHPEGRASARWSCRPISGSIPQESGQFERTLIVAEEGASVSYLEGCTAPKFDTNQLHAAVVELVALDHADIKYSTVQNWYAGDENGVGGIYNFVTKRGLCKGVELEDLVDAGRDRLGDHLEVSVAACCSATTRSASSIRSR